VLQCSPHTIRRRALAYGLAEPGQRVYTDTAQPDGTVEPTCTSRAPATSTGTQTTLRNWP
jgi:hypothetical protein